MKICKLKNGDCGLFSVCNASALYYQIILLKVGSKSVQIQIPSTSWVPEQGRGQAGAGLWGGHLYIFGENVPNLSC